MGKYWCAPVAGALRVEKGWELLAFEVGGCLDSGSFFSLSWYIQWGIKKTDNTAYWIKSAKW